jgi:hypothetical protein
MRTIGQTYNKKFRNLRTGEMEEKLCEEIVTRITRDEYGHNSRYSRQLVVTLHSPDTMTIKPVGFRSAALTVTVNVGEIYKTLLARKCQTEALVKARAKAEKNKERRARKARYAKERRFMDKVKRDNANA